jgi:hypothetical protein
MTLEQFKTMIDIISGLVTTVAILIGGIWTFIIFIVGRNHSPNIQLTIQCLPIIYAEQNAVLLTITARNIGQTLVNRERCYLFLTPVNQPIQRDGLLASRIDPLQQPMLSQYPPTFEIFSNTQSLNPQEQVAESILLDLHASCSLYKVYVEFYNKPRIGRQLSWSASNIFSMANATISQSITRR